MIITTEHAIEIYEALLGASDFCEKNKTEPSVKYTIARNIGRLKKHYKLFHKNNELRIQTYALKDEKNAISLKSDGTLNFGEKHDEAMAKYNELLLCEVEFDPYTIKRSEFTDDLPSLVQAILFDIIITE
jgi:hypothetical protein